MDVGSLRPMSDAAVTLTELTVGPPDGLAAAHGKGRVPLELHNAHEPGASVLGLADWQSVSAAE
jgi:hypothetical protein